MCSATAQSSVQNGNLRGYPSLASFIGSDRDFFIFRRFNALSARNLLYLQDELVELEDKLRTVDLADLQSENQRGLWNLHSRREDKNIERRYLMMQLNEKLKSYRAYLYQNPVPRGAKIRGRGCFVFPIPHSGPRGCSGYLRGQRSELDRWNKACNRSRISLPWYQRRYSVSCGTGVVQRTAGKVSWKELVSIFHSEGTHASTQISRQELICMSG